MTKQAHQLVVAGHAFAPMGMGEHARSSFRAFRSVAMVPQIRDIYESFPKDDPRLKVELEPYLVRGLSDHVNIFYINGDEVEQTVAHLGGLPGSARNIIYPLWELAVYPEEWAQKLDLFDEIWAPSAFIKDAIEAAVSKPVVHMPLACEARMERVLGRRWFGIPEAAFVFLFFFDFSSYVERKNPFAVLEAFRSLARDLPSSPVLLVIKLNRGHAAPQDYVAFLDRIDDFRDRVILIDRTLTDDGIKSLTRCCDCFVSLHRAEGFGFGLAEAMYLGKPVVGTGYSGNLDFMAEDSACLVRYELVPVRNGQYPHGEGQVWADPDLDHAVWHMTRIYQDTALRRQLGESASRTIRTHFSYRAAGLRYTDRLSISEPRWRSS